MLRLSKSLCSLHFILSHFFYDATKNQFVLNMCMCMCVLDMTYIYILNIYKYLFLYILYIYLTTHSIKSSTFHVLCLNPITSLKLHKFFRTELVFWSTLCIAKSCEQHFTGTALRWLGVFHYYWYSSEPFNTSSGPDGELPPRLRVVNGPPMN